MDLLRCLIGLLAVCGAVRAEEAKTLPMDDKAEAALLRTAGKGFQLHRTDHFVIAYNADPQVVAELIRRVESTYQSISQFCRYNDIETDPLERRLEVILFDKRREFDRYSRRIGFDSKGAAGVYFQGTNRSAFVNMYNDTELGQLQKRIEETTAYLDELEDQMQALSRRRNGELLQIKMPDGQVFTGTRGELDENVIEPTRRIIKTLDNRRKNYSERINLTVVQHEVAHQTLFNLGVHAAGAQNPTWLVEGLAMQFECPPDRYGAGVGKANQLRLHDLRRIVSDGEESKPMNGTHFMAAMDAEKLLSPEALVTEPELFARRGKSGAEVYATSWALVYYLRRCRSKQFGQYLKTLSERPANEEYTPEEELELFESHFGKLNDRFIKRWGDYVMRVGFRANASRM